jgi:hypothetical protein
MAAVTRLSSRVRIRDPFILLTSMILCLPALLATALPASATEILPHKAIYTLHNREAVGGDENLSADGMLIFEWLDTCDGWQVNQRAKLRLSSEQGETDFEWRQITWEAKDGHSYRYQSQEFQDGQKGDQRQGEVSLDDKGAPQLTMASPQRGQSALPADILLPTAHSLHLLKAAAAGDNYISAHVFDGTVSDSPMEIGAAIGPTMPQWQDQAKAFPALAHVPWRAVDLAFFMKGGDAEGKPDFEQSMRLYDNGVIGRMSFPFAGVDMVGDLAQLDVETNSKCKAGAANP